MKTYTGSRSRRSRLSLKRNGSWRSDSCLRIVHAGKRIVRVEVSQQVSGSSPSWLLRPARLRWRRLWRGTSETKRWGHAGDGARYRESACPKHSEQAQCKGSDTRSHNRIAARHYSFALAEDLAAAIPNGRIRIAAPDFNQIANELSKLSADQCFLRDAAFLLFLF
jgi:hypothetical protein